VETSQYKTTNRPATVQKPAASLKTVQRKAVTVRNPVQLQTSMQVSSPKDPAEKEADATAKKIMRMAVPESSISYVKTEKGGVFRQVKQEEKDKKVQPKLQSPYITRFADSGAFTQRKPEDTIHRKAEGQPNIASNVSADIQNSMASGSPLPLSVRRFMEPRFQANFSNVKIQTGDKAAKLNRQLNAQAFTVGNQIFFGKDKFQPEHQEGKELIAHELTHTIQQGAAIQRSENVTITQQAPVQVQRLGLSDALDYFADQANIIPGFRMFTIVLGVNPINMSSVDRSAANILRAIVEFIPGGGLITKALDNHGVFEKVGTWVEQQIKSLGLVGSAIKQAITQFLDSLSWKDIFALGGVWERAKHIFTEPIDRLIDFAKGLITGILKFIKDAILKPLAALAQETQGYDLLKAILRKDPITDEPVPRNPETLIGGFMKLIGQQEIWENIKKGNAIARAWQWFQTAMAGLMSFVQAIPGKIIDTITSLTIEDIVTVAGAFTKVVGAFGNIAGDFISWGIKQVISLLEILFSVVAPGVMPYIKKAQAAFTTIIKNPIGFVGNLVRAGKQGFEMFASNILTHLKAALIKWITGPLGEAGVYIPQSFSLIEIVKLVLSVLGLTWQNIRSKLVKIIPEPVLVVIEKTAGILVTLVKDGPAAAWEQIKAELSELKDQLIAQVTEMISTEVVKAAIAKLVSMLNPAGAVIQAIIAIYNTVTFFIQKIKQLAAVVGSFIDSISAIANGQVANAAKKVELTMANTLTIVIAFLAKFAGLGNIPDKLVGIIKKIRAPIDKGLDKIVAWLGKMLEKAKQMFSKKDKVGKPDDQDRVRNVAEQSSSLTLADGESHTVYVKVSNGQLFVEMASFSKAQMDLVLGRLALVCNKAKNDYKAALESNPTKKETIEKTIAELDYVIEATRKAYRGNGSVYEEVDNILSGSIAPYDKMTNAQRGNAAEDYLRKFVVNQSVSLSKRIKVGFKTLEGLKFKSGYVDEGGNLLPPYRNVRSTFYNVKWNSGVQTHKTNELNRLRSEALKRDPSLATRPDKQYFYWSEDKTGSSSIPAYIADTRKPGDEPELDHVDPLANRWLKTGTSKPGNNTNQSDRDTDYNLTTNLQVLSKRMNGSKSGPSFTLQVETDFRGPKDPP